MKKKFPKIKLAFQKYFLVILLLICVSGYIKAQNIDLTPPCNNSPLTLAGQVKSVPIANTGTWAIPSATQFDLDGDIYTVAKWDGSTLGFSQPVDMGGGTGTAIIYYKKQ